MYTCVFVLVCASFPYFNDINLFSILYLYFISSVVIVINVFFVYISLLCFVLFFETGSLCSFGSPGTHSVD